ncbi:MAG: TolC family protein, partial [Bdellovibrionales bacterium]|nr:TolC family protein [Bdellovibrionales bacterium]
IPDSLQITPELVVNLVLKNGLAAEKIRFEQQKVKAELFSAQSLFEPKLQAEANYTDSKAETLSISPTIESQTLGLNFGLSKKFATGSLLSWRYNRTSQNSIPSSLLATTFPTTLTLDTMELEFTQSLLRNGWGQADRNQLNSAITKQESSEWQKLEDLEALVLETMKAYWDAYVAKENLEKSLAARDRYDRLVKIVRKKASLGFTGPGELSRIEAEYEAQIQLVKKRSATYLNLVDQLEIQLKVTLPDELNFYIKDPLPPLPELPTLSLENLRAYKGARAKLQQLNLNLEAADSRNRSAFDLVLKTSLTGLDEQASEALSEVTGATKPIYYIGFKWESFIGEDTLLAATKSLQADRNIQKLELVRVIDQLKYELKAHQRLAQAEYLVAQSAIKSVTLRKRSAREIEQAYRQGRQTISELIQTLDKLFESETAQARAIGDYHIALNQWAATRDELIRQPSATTEVKQ